MLPSAPPIMITDLIDRCVKCDDGKWRYIERTFVPLFMGGAAPTVPPESIAENFNSGQKKALTDVPRSFDRPLLRGAPRSCRGRAFARGSRAAPISRSSAASAKRVPR